MFPSESRGGIFTFPQATLAHPEWTVGNICLVPALNQSHCLRPARWAVWAVHTRAPLEAPNLESPPSLLGTGGIPRLLQGPLQGTEFSPVQEGARPCFLPLEDSPGHGDGSHALEQSFSVVSHDAQFGPECEHLQMEMILVSRRTHALYSQAVTVTSSGTFLLSHSRQPWERKGPGGDCGFLITEPPAQLRKEQ